MKELILLKSKKIDLIDLDNRILRLLFVGYSEGRIYLNITLRDYYINYYKRESSLFGI